MIIHGYKGIAICIGTDISRKRAHAALFLRTTGCCKTMGGGFPCQLSSQEIVIVIIVGLKQLLVFQSQAVPDSDILRETGADGQSALMA